MPHAVVYNYELQNSTAWTLLLHIKEHSTYNYEIKKCLQVICQEPTLHIWGFKILTFPFLFMNTQLSSLLFPSSYNILKTCIFQTSKPNGKKNQNSVLSKVLLTFSSQKIFWNLPSLHIWKVTIFKKIYKALSLISTNILLNLHHTRWNA